MRLANSELPRSPLRPDLTSRDLLNERLGTRRWRTYLAAFLITCAVHLALLFLWKPDLDILPQFALAYDSFGLEVSLITATPADDPIETPTELDTDPAALGATVPFRAESEVHDSIAAQVAKIDDSTSAQPEPTPIENPPAESELHDPIAAQVAKVDDSSTSAQPEPTLVEKKPEANSKSRSAESRKGNARGRESAARPLLGSASARPSYLHNPHPPYPEEARRARQEGVVTLRVSIDSAGRVKAVRVERASGYPMLDQSALNTVRYRWRFKPAISNGLKVAAEVSVPIRFSLD